MGMFSYFKSKLNIFKRLNVSLKFEKSVQLIPLLDRGGKSSLLVRSFPVEQDHHSLSCNATLNHSCTSSFEPTPLFKSSFLTSSSVLTKACEAEADLASYEHMKK